MSFINRSSSLRTNPRGSSHWAGSIPRVLGTAIILAILPFSAGCSPEGLVATVIVVPVLYAHLRQHSAAARQRPAAPRNGPYVPTSPERASAVYLASAQPGSQAPSSPALRKVWANRQPTILPESYSSADERITGTALTIDAPPVRRTQPPGEPPAALAPLDKAALAYREMRWEEAVGILHKAMGTGTCTDSDLNKAHILLGAMAYQQGDIEAARRHFGEAHRRDPQTVPSPELFPPPLIDFYRSAHGR